MNMAQKSAFRERANAAFLGLALGDAYGAPLEFIRGESVHKHPVKIEAGSFRWTDDTHMAIFLAKAILDCR
jgi:ADP-ribosyl-[dinitrogen reductase] hydrolase